MRLYLDEDIADFLVQRLLIADGHDVELPRQVQLLGKDDPIQLAYAISRQRTIVTGNHKHFGYLHDLIVVAGGHHFGILIIDRENNPRRDLTPRGVVTCFQHLVRAGMDLRDQFLVLNHWR